MNDYRLPVNGVAKCFCGGNSRILGPIKRKRFVVRAFDPLCSVCSCCHLVEDVYIFACLAYVFIRVILTPQKIVQHSSVNLDVLCLNV